MSPHPSRSPVRTLGSLTGIRSGAALSMLAYLSGVLHDATDLSPFPYFPARMRAGQQDWFDVLRQKVRVADRTAFDATKPQDAAGAASSDSHRWRHEGADSTFVWGEPLPADWRRIIVLGDPGGGKSWLLRYETALRAEKTSSELNNRLLDLRDVVLPIRLSVADLARRLEAAMHAPTRAIMPAQAHTDPILRVLFTEVLARADAALTNDRHESLGRFQGLEKHTDSFEHVVVSALHDGRAVVLLDAWDEVRGDTHDLKRRLETFVKGFAGTVILTSRNEGYKRDETPLPKAIELQLLVLDRPDVRAFVGEWFQQETASEPAKAALLDAFDADRGQVFQLARNPLLLTLLCRAYEDAGDGRRRRYPTHRVELYARAVEGLVRDWREWNQHVRRPDDGEVRDTVTVLSRVAGDLFGLDPPYERAWVTTVVRTHLAAALEQASAQHLPHALEGQSDGQVLQLFLDEGLLVPTGGAGDSLMFLHRTFHEYLTGVAMAASAVALTAGSARDANARAAAALAQTLRDTVADPARHEAALLALGNVGLVSSGDSMAAPGWAGMAPGAGPELAAATINGLIANAPPEGRDAALALMGRAVAELGEAGVGSDCYSGVRSQLLTALRGATESTAPGAGERPGVSAGDPRGVLARLVGRVRRALAEHGVQTGAASLEEVKQRVAFGDVLARIGDTRFHGPERWYLPNDVACGFAKPPADDLLGFVPVPPPSDKGQEFQMGSAEGDEGAVDDEKPLHPVRLSDLFYLARWPVTVAQFGWFVKATGYDAGTGWERGLANHPVVYISWHDAMAFCDFLTRELHKPDNLQRLPLPLRVILQEKRGEEYRWHVTLPSEAQWEWAARGKDRHVYPGGQPLTPDRANYSETGLAATSAVGCFPCGTSWCNAEEMAGSVWEWTRSQWKEYPYVPTDGREDTTDTSARRVLRGGSFGGDRSGVRAAARLNGGPDYRDFHFGFRAALCPFRS